jgi:hypothetical protein
MGIVPADILQRLGRISAFEKSQQYTTPCADSGAGGGDAGGDAGLCEFGGEIEVQSGPGHAIIQSDNTQEAVWIWSWERQLNADPSYSPQIANAFTFLSVFPGWLKWEGTGDTGPDYYSIYNCAWGVRAIVEYEASSGDLSHHSYGQMCAEHIQSYAATVASSAGSESGLIDMATASFAASGLWIWGTAQGDSAMQASAVEIGSVVKTWLDTNPEVTSSQTWAVTGAAVYDGVLGSYMKGHPDELVAWVQQSAPNLGGWIDESQPASPNDWTDWRNAWNAWNMLAQFDTGTVLGEGATGPHNQTALTIYTNLVAEDTQGNGAIPGSQQRETDDEDETWITAYLVYFGMRPLLADMQLDAGAPPPPDGGSDGGRDAGKSEDSGFHLVVPPPTPPTPTTSSDGGCAQASGGSDPFGVGLLTAGIAIAWAGGARRRRRQGAAAPSC